MMAYAFNNTRDILLARRHSRYCHEFYGLGLDGSKSLKETMVGGGNEDEEIQVLAGGLELRL